MKSQTILRPFLLPFKYEQNFTFLLVFKTNLKLEVWKMFSFSKPIILLLVEKNHKLNRKVQGLNFLIYRLKVLNSINYKLSSNGNLSMLSGDTGH